jgi:WD40 repeat protein
VQALVGSPDGKWLISAGDDGLICRWDISGDKTSAQPILLKGHEDAPIETLAISSDSRWALSGSWDDTAMVWDLKAPADKPGIRLAGHTEDVVAATISRDVRWLATASLDHTIRLWRVTENGPLTDGIILNGHDAEIDCIEISGDSRWLVSIDIDGVGLRWDLTASEPAKTKSPLGNVLHRRNVLQIDPQGKWFASGSDDGNLLIYGLENPSERREYQVSAEPIESLVRDATGRYLFLGDAGGNAFRYEWKEDGTAANPLRLVGHLAACVAIAVAADASYCVTGSWDGTARFWDFSTGSDQPPVSLVLGGEHGGVQEVAVGGGEWVAAATKDGSVLLWEVDLCRLILQATGGDRPTRKKSSTVAGIRDGSRS